MSSPVGASSIKPIALLLISAMGVVVKIDTYAAATYSTVLYEQISHSLVSLYSNENQLNESIQDIPHACFFDSRIASIEKPISLDINPHYAYVSRSVSEDKIGAADQEANSHGSKGELREVCNENDRQWDTRLSGSLLNLFLLLKEWNGHSIFTIAKT